MVRRSLWLFTAIASLAFMSAAARAATSPYDAIYVFGDSYCDVGNIYTATNGATPAAPYYNGRFSNGPIWIDHVAGAWGLPLKASLLGGTDYAFGGAYVTIPENVPDSIPPSVPQQVALYLSSVHNHADPNALYVIEGGGNDILAASAANNVSVETLAFQIALGISESELALRRAGARHFLIPDLLDVGQLPAGKANANFASSASVATNNALDFFLGSEELLEGIHIYRINVFSLFHDVAQDASHFGFTDVVDPCLNSVVVPPVLCPNPYVSLFWDAEHPTEFGHAFFAVTVEANLGPKP